MVDYDTTRIDGEAIPSGQSFMPGALGLGSLAIGTIQDVAAGNTQNTITFSSVAAATSYNIYWLTTSPVTKLTGTKISGVTSPYTHSGLSNGTTYYYIYTTEDGVSESEDSNEVSGTPGLPSPPILVLFALRA